MELESTEFSPAYDWDVESYPWQGIGLIDKLLIVGLPLLSVGAFVLPFLDHALLRRLARLPGLGGLTTWLVNSNGSWLAGIALLLVWIGFLVFKRWRIVSNEHLWVDAGCPQCQEHELVRVSRTRGDRWYNLLRIPAFRYACRNCTWRGLRIGRRHRHLVMAQEEQITASSATLEPAGVPTQDELLTAEVAFNADAHESVAEVLDVAIVEDAEIAEPMDDNIDLVADVSSLPLSIEPEESEPVAGQTPVEETAEPAQPSDDDLDWLWQKLSDGE